jgi:hypothetical protein
MASAGNPAGAVLFRGTSKRRSALVHHILEDKMRGMLLWFLGIPIPVIILLYLFHVI